MTDIPTTMRSLVAPRQCGPDEFEIQELPVPTITKPTHVLLKIRYAGISSGDVLFSSGRLDRLHKFE